MISLPGPENSGDEPALDVQGLTVAYDRKPVLLDVDMTAQEGRLVGIIGPNGAGKTTLLKAVLGLVPVASGRISIYGRPPESQRGLVAYVPQRESVDWSFPVSALDVAAMGLYPHIGWFRRVTRSHRRTALESLMQVGMEQFADRQISRLSGGQQQRVFLARALAQDARLYLMDEPFAGVDAATEKAIVGTLQALREQGRTVVAVHHDLNTAAEYFDDVLLLNLCVVASGDTASTFTEENILKTYGARHDLKREREPAPRRAEDPAP